MKKVTTLLFLLILNNASLVLYAQSSKTDSLENLLLKHTQEDTIRVNLLNDIAYEFRKKNFDKSIKYDTEALELADKINFKKGKAQSLRHIGLAYYYKSDYPKAIEYYKKAIKINTEINDKKGRAVNYNSIGNAYKKQKNYTKALEYYKKALKTNTEIKNKSKIADNYNNIGNIYEYQDYYTKALEYQQKALEINKELGNKSKIADNYSNIGFIYKIHGAYPKALEYQQKALEINKKIDSKVGISKNYTIIGNIYRLQKFYQKALEYHHKALEIDKALGSIIGIATDYNNIGLIYDLIGNYSKALEYQEKALEINKEIGRNTGITRNYNNIGNIYIKQENYSKAFEYFQKSLAINTKTGEKYVEAYSYAKLGLLFLKQGDFNKAYNFSKKAFISAKERGETDLIKESSEILAKSSAALSLYKQAYEYHVIFKTMNDSLYNAEIIKKLTGQEYQYKYEKEKQAAELEQQKKDAVQAEKMKQQKTIRNYFITGFTLMLVLALVIFWNFIQKRKANIMLAKQKEEIEAQAEELKTANDKLLKLNQFKQAMTGMIVHDLKNPLNAIINASQSLSLQRQNESMKQSGKQMLNLVLNILDVHKYENAKMTVDKVEHSLFKLSQNAINEVNFLAEQKNITLINNITSQTGVKCDKEITERIFVNLLTNAIKYTPNNGKAIIETKNNNKDNGFVNIQVSDTGQGIPKDKLSTVFDEYVQIAAKKSGKMHSTGLGLTFCKMAVEAHGGKIFAESEENKGTNFIFTLPLAKEFEKVESNDKTVQNKSQTILSDTDKELLKPYVKELSTLMVYQTTKVKKILNSIDYKESVFIQNWIKDVNDSLFVMNEEKFNDLINQIS